MIHGVVVVVIAGYFDFQLPMKSEPTRCEFESRFWRDVLDATLCDKVYQ